MSYIRSVSNPEGLYVIASISKQAEFFLPGRVDALHMPLEIFEGLLKKYVRQEAELDSSEGKEIYLHKGASLKFLAPPEQVAAYGRSSGDDWKWFLHYEGWENPIEMWDVTLDTIAQDARRAYEQEEFLALMELMFASLTTTPKDALALFKVWLESR